MYPDSCFFVSPPKSLVFVPISFALVVSSELSGEPERCHLPLPAVRIQRDLQGLVRGNRTCFWLFLCKTEPSALPNKARAALIILQDTPSSETRFTFPQSH